MYYCDECATENRWPKTGFKSKGRCEVCGTRAECNDRKSSALPKVHEPKGGKR